MKVLQHNLNHCEAAHDLLMQTVRDWKIDVVIIIDPYIPQRTNQWASDATGKAAIWSCGKLLVQDNIDSTQKDFVRIKLGNVYFYNLSDHRVISWEVATGNSTKVPPHKKTNARGWKVRMFDSELYRTTLATGPINANNTTEEAEEVMKSVVNACDATMPRKSTCNRHSSVYW